MTDKQLNKILNGIFFDFEENIFCNNGCWPRNVNLVFAFADYIDMMSDAKIGGYLRSNNPKMIAKFRKTVKNGINLWLQENMKTLVI